MKRISLAIAVLLSVAVNAQDIKTAKKAFEKNEFAKAREAIELAWANPKVVKEYENWFLKADIYNALSKDASKADSASFFRMLSFECYKAGIELDPKNGGVMLLAETKIKQQIFNLFQEEIQVANSSLDGKNYDKSISAFKNTSTIGKYTIDKGWSGGGMDTALKATLNFYIGYAYMNKKEDENTLEYYKKLIESKITNDQNYLIAYEWVAEYYSKKKDYDNFKQYIDLGKKAFPKERWFDDVELNYLNDNGKSEEALLKQEEMLKANPEDFDRQFYYATLLFQKVFNEKNVANKTELISKMETAYKKCMELQPDNMEVVIEFGKMYFNLGVDIQNEIDAIKGKTPENDAKKKEMKVKVEERINQAIPVFEKAFNFYDGLASRDGGQKSKYKTTAQLLRDCYSFLGNDAKAKFFEKKIDEMNK